MISSRYLRLVAVKNGNSDRMDTHTIERMQFIRTLPVSIQMYYVAGGIDDVSIDMLMKAKLMGYKHFKSPFDAFMFFTDELAACTLLPGDLTAVAVLFPEESCQLAS